jgi:hypothetical protein
LDIPGYDFSSYTTLSGDFGLGNIVEPYNAVKTAKNAYAYTTLTCLFLAFLFMVFMRYFTGVLVWVSLFLAGGSLIGISLLM